MQIHIQIRIKKFSKKATDKGQIEMVFVMWSISEFVCLDLRICTLRAGCFAQIVWHDIRLRAKGCPDPVRELSAFFGSVENTKLTPVHPTVWGWEERRVAKCHGYWQVGVKSLGNHAIMQNRALLGRFTLPMWDSRGKIGAIYTLFSG